MRRFGEIPESIPRSTPQSSRTPKTIHRRFHRQKLTILTTTNTKLYIPAISRELRKLTLTRFHRQNRGQDSVKYSRTGCSFARGKYLPEGRLANSTSYGLDSSRTGKSIEWPSPERGILSSRRDATTRSYSVHPQK